MRLVTVLLALAPLSGCDEIIEVNNSRPEVRAIDYCVEGEGEDARLFVVLEVTDFEGDPVDVELVRCAGGAGADATCTEGLLLPGPAGHGTLGLSSTRGTPGRVHPIEWAHPARCPDGDCDALCPETPSELARVSTCTPASLPPSPLTLTVYARDDHAEDRDRIVTRTTVFEAAPGPCEE